MTPLLLLACALMHPVDPPNPIAPVPSERQLAWHDRGMYAFVHFNMNTFTDQEWGDGQEKSAAFNPTELDTDQWCRVFKDAGMSGVIITAKHHDGFCLWPSAYTEHSVKNSPWRNGEGDLLRELSDSCRKYGLGFGVYLSPWDRNNPLYGTGGDYNEYFSSQLRETLANYGPVFEVWFDGACGEGPNGKRQVYDFPMFHDVVRELHPDACIFSDAGPDIRWIGNERGIAGETNWSMMRRDEFYPGIPGRNRELNEGQEDGTHWLPGEVDVSIRPGWYYHESQDQQVKDLDQLLEIWYASIGRNANLLLNFPVDRRGLVHEHDAAAAIELKLAIDSITGEDVAAGRSASANNVRGDDERYAAARAVDGNPKTFWAPDDGENNAFIEIRLDGPTPVNHIDLGEYLPLGQRVRAFTVQARSVDGWTPLARGTTIGNRRILRFPTVIANRIRVIIEDSRASPTLRHVRVYSSPPEVQIVTDSTAFIGSTEAYLIADRESAEIRYTLDGSEPSAKSKKHLGGAITISEPTVLKAIAMEGSRRSIRASTTAFTKFDPDSLVEPVRPLGDPPTQTRALGVRCYEGGWQSLHDLPGREPVAEKTAEKIDSEPKTREEHVALVFDGLLRVPKTGVYDFHLASDDGSRLYLGDSLAIDNDGLHGVIEKSAHVPLKQGWHAIRVEWFNATGDGELSLEWGGPELTRRALRGNDLGIAQE